MPPRKKAPTKKTESNPLTDAMEKLKGAFKDQDIGAVDLDPELFRKSRAHLSTGSIVIDYIIGGLPNKHGVLPCPGLPRGAVTEVWGHEGAGKTTVALHAAAKTCKEGGPNGGPGTVVFVDWEHALDLSYAKTIGVPVDDPNRFRLFQPQTLEQGLGIIWSMTKAGVDLVIIDSVGAGVPEARLKQKDSEKGELGRVGLLAAKWSAVLPELVNKASQTGTAILGISQLRKKISTNKMASRGPDTTPQGGEAWKFYSWVRIGLRRIQYEKGKIYDPLTHTRVETAIKSMVNVKMEKCKVSASQGREATIHIAFGEGIDDMRSIFDIAAAHKIILKQGAWYSFQPANGTLIKEQGLDKFRAAVKETPGMYTQIHQQVVAKITSLGDGMTLLPELDDDGIDELDELINDRPEIVVEGAEEADEED